MSFESALRHTTLSEAVSPMRTMPRFLSSGEQLMVSSLPVPSSFTWNRRSQTRRITTRMALRVPALRASERDLEWRAGTRSKNDRAITAHHVVGAGRSTDAQVNARQRGTGVIVTLTV